MFPSIKKCLQSKTDSRLSGSGEAGAPAGGCWKNGGGVLESSAARDELYAFPLVDLGILPFEADGEARDAREGMADAED